jgi:hypothetical protein
MPGCLPEIRIESHKEGENFVIPNPEKVMGQFTKAFEFMRERWSDSICEDRAGHKILQGS